MTVYSGVESRQLFIGLSTDPKPTPADFGAKFYEQDTGLTYIFTGAPVAPWVEYLPQWPPSQDFPLTTRN